MNISAYLDYIQDPWARGWIERSYADRSGVFVARAYMDITDGNPFDALAFGQVMFWADIDDQSRQPRMQHKRGEHLWIVKTLEEWQHELGFKSTRTVQDCFARLARLKLIFKEQHKSPYHDSKVVTFIRPNWSQIGLLLKKRYTGNVHPGDTGNVYSEDTADVSPEDTGNVHPIYSYNIHKITTGDSTKRVFASDDARATYRAATSVTAKRLALRLLETKRVSTRIELLIPLLEKEIANETGTTTPKSPPQTRPQDAAFDAISKYWKTGKGSMTGKLKKFMTGHYQASGDEKKDRQDTLWIENNIAPGMDAAEIERFVSWYEASTERCRLPQNPEKLHVWVAQGRACDYQVEVEAEPLVEDPNAPVNFAAYQLRMKPEDFVPVEDDYALASADGEIEEYFPEGAAMFEALRRKMVRGPELELERV